MNRRLSILVFFVFTQQPGFSQIIEDRNMLIGPDYSGQKYSISFADQSQLAYDGMRLKQYIGESLMETGDLAYYNGKYFNAAARYLHVVGALPHREDKLIVGLYKELTYGIDTTKLNAEYTRLYATAANVAGMMYQTRGKYVPAETLLSLAMEVRARTFGKTSREYINSLHNMAVLKKDLGQYDEAERMFNYLVPTLKKLYTVNSLQYVICLNNRAMLLAELGRSKEAIASLDEALKLGETVLPANFFDYERILTNRALLEQESGNLEQAEKYYQQVMSGIEKKGFEDHPDYNNVLVYYGSLRVERNDPDLSAFLSMLAEKVKKRYGGNHPLLAKALINSGDYYLNKKEYGTAKSIYNEAAGIQLEKLGEKHKDYLNTLLKIALCEWYLQDLAKASEHFQKAISNYLFLVNNLFRTMSEAEKANFWRTFKPAIDTYLAFVFENGQNNPSLLREAYDLWTSTKGILINSTRQTKTVILGSSDMTTRKLYQDWLNMKNTLAAYYSSPLEDLKEDNIDLDEIEKQANAAEKELTRRSSRFSAEYTQRVTRFENISHHLQEGEMAVEIIRAQHYYGEKKGQSVYAALLVKKNAAAPLLVPIGNGVELEKDWSAYKRAIRNKLADSKSYTVYWQPLEGAIVGNKTIYLSVDGIYNNINPNTLQRSDGSYLLDHYNIILLPNTNVIVTGPTALSIASVKKEALLIGFPLFGNDQVIPPLPETKEEVQQIDTVLAGNSVTTKLYMEQAASEENIKAVKGPSILHVATHGFFYPDVNMGKSMSRGIQVSKARNNVLLRSGLLFNGAAAVYNDEPNLLGNNNGVLYAFEAMNLDLQDTKIVVLSACETGMGEIVNGEGVYGLCRSFQVAGASRVIMSLWKVDDRATRELMTSFYNNWVKLNDPQQAFIQAQKTTREKYPQPYYWGAFVLMN